MTHKIAGSISFFLCKKGMIEGKEQDIYQYGFEVFLDTVLETCMLMAIGVLFHRIFETCLFIILFTGLRKFAGGYHAETKTRCILLMILIYVSNMYIAGLVVRENVMPFMFAGTVGALVISMLAPVLHYNKELFPEEIIVNRNKTRGLCVVYLTGMLIFKEWSCTYAGIIAVTLVEIAILSIWGEVKYHERNVECG